MTVAALRRHWARQLEHKLAVGARYLESGLVFTWLDGSPIHPLRFTRWFEQHARRAGLPKIRLHDLRHSYAAPGGGRAGQGDQQAIGARNHRGDDGHLLACPAWLSTGSRPTRSPG